MRVRTTLAVLVAVISSVARAQPVDPYAPDPSTATPTSSGPDDPVLAEQIAQSLVVRAQELYDVRVFVDAKQLAVEALIKSPRGAAAEHARFLMRSANKQLGITDAPEPASPVPAGDPIAPTPVVDLKLHDEAALPPQPEIPGPGRTRTAARVHGALFGGLIGSAIGSLFSKTSPAGGAIPLGIVGALAAGLYVPRIVASHGWSEAQVRTAGAGSVWGGVIGGLFADAVRVTGTTARQVLVGASLGSSAGVLAGAGFARTKKFTSGDVALIDTLAGAGALGGLTVGMLMQPIEGEAYSVNSILGTVAGLVVGTIAAPQTNTTPRRMARVAGVAAIGAGAPFLLYAAIHDSSTNGDERLVGALSSIGMIAGLYVGFRLTSDLDVDRDVGDAPPKVIDDAPAAVIGRQSDGRWSLGALSIAPLSPALAPQPGMTVPVIGGAF